MRLSISSCALVAACVAVAVLGTPVSEEREKRASTISNVSGQLRTAASIAQGVATVLKVTSNVFPLATVFTGLFGFMLGLMQDDKALWERMEKRMEEIAKAEVANYHDLLAQGFISGIKRSAELFNKFTPTTAGRPNNQKINEGVVLSGIINNNRQWVNVELGKNPQRMILYYMEVASIDVAVLYNLAALYGKADRSHWTRLETRVGHHITDAENAARKVMSWRISDKYLKCERTECQTGTRRCGPKGSQTCAVKAACMKGSDQLTDVCRTQRYTSRCGARACTKTRRVCEKYNKTKVGASNCDFFKNEIRSKTQSWLNKNVYEAVNMWKDLKKRGR